MALMFPARFLNLGLILFLVSTLCLINCQPNSPQNIETHYPYYPPPLPSPSPPALHPPVPPPVPPITPSQPPPPVAPAPLPKSENGNSNRAIATAVVATAASTLVVSGLLFFLLRRRSLRQKKDENGSSNGGLPMLSRDQYTRFNGNIKGLIVDENGLDVLYWRKLQEKSENRIGKRVSHDPKNEKEGEEEVEGTNPKGKRVEPIQEAPLLRGRSSTSHVKPAVINGGPNVAPTSEGIALMDVEEPKPSTQSLTPSPAPAETPESTTLSAIPARSSPPTAPPPPPTPPTTKAAPAPPPPPPPKVGAMALASKVAPPSLPKPMQGQSSSGKGQAETGQVKLKPLHWDKVNRSRNHSMVWNKMEGGSFK